MEFKFDGVGGGAVNADEGIFVFDGVVLGGETIEGFLESAVVGYEDGFGKIARIGVGQLVIIMENALGGVGQIDFDRVG